MSFSSFEARIESDIATMVYREEHAFLESIVVCFGTRKRHYAREFQPVVGGEESTNVRIRTRLTSYEIPASMLEYIRFRFGLL